MSFFRLKNLIFIIFMAKREKSGENGMRRCASDLVPKVFER